MKVTINLNDDGQPITDQQRQEILSALGVFNNNTFTVDVLSANGVLVVDAEGVTVHYVSPESIGFFSAPDAIQQSITEDLVTVTTANDVEARACLANILTVLRTYGLLSAPV